MTEKLYISNDRGRQLSAELVLVRGAGTPFPVVIHSHGWGSSKDSDRARTLAAALAEVGIASLLFDYTGHGKSEGSLRELGVEQLISDLRCVVDRAHADPRFDRLGISAASMGALAALYLSAAKTCIDVLVCRGAVVPEVEQASQIAAPVRLIHGDCDTVAPLETVRVFAEALDKPGDLIVLEGCDHTFSRPEDLQLMTRASVEWFAKWLQPSQNVSDSPG